MVAEGLRDTSDLWGKGVASDDYQLPAEITVAWSVTAPEGA